MMFWMLLSMPPMLVILRSVKISSVYSGPGHSLPQAPFVEECLFERSDLQVQEVRYNIFILFAASGGLHHLIDGAVVFSKESFGEINSTIVNYFSFLVGNQMAVSAMRG
jgi:hypothetical protein